MSKFRISPPASLLSALLALSMLAGCNAATTAVEDQPPTAGASAASAAAEPTPCADEAARCAIDLSGNALVPAAAPASLPVSEQGDGSKSQLPPEQQGVTPAAAGESRIPLEIARLSLAEGDVALLDLRLDEAAGRAWVVDSERTVHGIDLASMAEVAAIATSGDRLTLDAPNRRLYVSPDWTLNSDESAQVTVIDTATGAIVGSLRGSRIAADSARNRLYVGDVVGFFEQNAPGVRLYDGATLELLAEGEQGGEPVYNPLRDELIIVNYSAFTADAQTLELREDLFPELSAETLRGCNGCRAVYSAAYLPIEELVAIDVRTISAGKGAGYYPPALLYAAADMQPIESPTVEVVALCGSEPRVNGLVQGARLAHSYYSRYLVFNNLSVLDEKGATLHWKDGLAVPFANAQTAVAYVDDWGSATWVLDHATLDPIGVLPPFCPFTQGASGRIYAADLERHDLIVFEQTGGVSVGAAADAATLGSQRAIQHIVPSPAFADDQTIFLVTANPDGGESLLKSVDGGAGWVVLGGLPTGQGLALEITVSPAYASDQTIFAAGHRGDAYGVGVWLSSDGGSTWSPRWHGLEHLRVSRIELSPRFGTDQTLLAWSRYDRIQPFDDGFSIHRSRDAGLQWTRVITAEYADLLPAASAYLPVTRSADSPIRKTDWHTPLEVRLASGAWTTATVALDGEWLHALLPVPGDEDGYYVVTNVSVLRTPDAGLTWQRWDDAWLAGRDYVRELTAATLTAPAPDGSYRLLLGTRAGELAMLDPATMEWSTPADEVEAAAPEPVIEAPAQGPSPLATPVETAVATPITTSIATAVATPPPVPAGTPLPETAPAGLFPPEGQFATQWANDAALQAELGFARTRQPDSTNAAVQNFENGQMLWRQDTQQIMVFLYDGTWSTHPDTFKEGDAERDPNLYTPGELLQPERGFGKLWRTDVELQEAIGWATAKEAPATLLVQEFERGWMITRGAQVFVLTGDADGGRWH